MNIGLVIASISIILFIVCECLYFAKLSKSNVIELICYKQEQEELHLLEKEFLKALTKKEQLEKEGYVVVLQVTTKAGLKR